MTDSYGNPLTPKRLDRIEKQRKDMFKKIGYIPTEEERKAQLWCIRNDVRVSPKGIFKDEDHWRLEVSLDGTTWHKSPEKYTQEDLWPKYYSVCTYYYNKRDGV